MTLILSYFRTRHMALLPPLFAAVFALILLLYGLPLYAVGYACALCLPVYLAALCVSFSRFVRRHRTLSSLLMVTHSVRAACYASRVLFIKDGEVFHQLYRGADSREMMYQKINDTLTMLTTGGDAQ